MLLRFYSKLAQRSVEICLRKNVSSLVGDIPKIVGVSGRTEEACATLLDLIKTNEADEQFVSKVQDISMKNISVSEYRGFSVLSEEPVKEIARCSPQEPRRPIWFVGVGMETQWPGMGRDLMMIPAFNETMHRCANALKPEGVDLIHLMLNSTEETFLNIVNSFVMVAAVQIGLVDLLTSVNIKPDGVIGISLGELVCAYADGSLTLEETILTAYWRGMCIKESNSIPCCMATVTLSWEETAKLCPPNVVPIVHLSQCFVVVAGPKRDVADFIHDLNSKGIYGMVQKGSKIAYHTEYLSGAGLLLKQKLRKVIPNPRKRSSKWLSTSVPASQWESPLARICGPDYFVNSLLQPVFFYEAVQHIPPNAVMIEISSSVKLDIVLKSCMPATATHVGLQLDKHSRNVQYLLTALGKLFNLGAQLDFTKLYSSGSGLKSNIINK